MERKGAAILVAILIVGFVAPAAAQPADAPGPSDPDAGNQTEEGDGPPGFVAGLIDAVTPDFLSNLFKNLPVPGFVKGFFGADKQENSTQG